MTPLLPYGPQLASGVLLTLLLTAIALSMGSVLGIGLAIIRLSRIDFGRRLAAGFVTFFVATPVLVQLYFIYYVAPQALGVSLSDNAVVAITLGLNGAAVLAENFRAGLQSVDRGQGEAAGTLGLSRWQVFRFVVFPQAIRVVLPVMGSTTIGLLKDSSIATFIGANDLLNVGRIVSDDTYLPLQVFSLVAVIYFVLTYPISIGTTLLERRWRTARS
jgi:glutamine transport system permease protein